MECGRRVATDGLPKRPTKKREFLGGGSTTTFSLLAFQPKQLRTAAAARLTLHSYLGLAS